MAKRPRFEIYTEEDPEKEALHARVAELEAENERISSGVNDKIAEELAKGEDVSSVLPTVCRWLGIYATDTPKDRAFWIASAEYVTTLTAELERLRLPEVEVTEHAARGQSAQGEERLAQEMQWDGVRG